MIDKDNVTRWELLKQLLLETKKTDQKIAQLANKTSIYSDLQDLVTKRLTELTGEGG